MRLGPACARTWPATAFAENRTMYAYITPDQVGQDWVDILVTHELTHLVFDTATHNIYRPAPHWLNEGIAVYLSEGYSERVAGQPRPGAGSQCTHPAAGHGRHLWSPATSVSITAMPSRCRRSTTSSGRTATRSCGSSSAATRRACRTTTRSPGDRHRSARLQRRLDEIDRRRRAGRTRPAAGPTRRGRPERGPRPTGAPASKVPARRHVQHRCLRAGPGATSSWCGGTALRPPATAGTGAMAVVDDVRADASRPFGRGAGLMVILAPPGPPRYGRQPPRLHRPRYAEAAV